MADLSLIRMRALVAETDVGKVRPGEPVSVVVDAFQNRTFQGTVEKIEPQAVVQQSVTMFPVLVSISNEDGSLLPGMNGETTMLVDRRTNVLSVPADALRSMREFAALAPTLGMNADSLRAQAMRPRKTAPACRDSGAAGPTARVAAGVPRLATARGAAGAVAVEAEGMVVVAAWLRRRRCGVRLGARGALASAHGAGRRRWWRRAAVRWRGGRFGGRGGQGLGGVGGGMGGMRGGGASRMQWRSVKTDSGLKPRIVRTGLSNYDYVEVLDGLQEGESVCCSACSTCSASATRW
jgi:HlyD family secretion protein